MKVVNGATLELFLSSIDFIIFYNFYSYAKTVLLTSPDVQPLLHHNVITQSYIVPCNLEKKSRRTMAGFMNRIGLYFTDLYFDLWS